MKYFDFKTVLIAIAICSMSCNDDRNNEINSKKSTTIISKTPKRYLDTPKRLRAIIDSIAKINTVEYESVGLGGWEGANYRNFKKLKAKANIEELVTLTQNENAVVACYASWALADRSYPNLKLIFRNFLDDNETVETFSGCIMSGRHMASELYHRYWNNTSFEDRSENKILQELDSMILYQPKPDWLLALRALDNRVYDEPYKSRIVELAFDKTNREALFYLSNFHKAEYYKKIETALLLYLRNTNFKNTGTSDYFRTIEELLRFNNPDINTEIVEKMKKDRHWHHEPEKFRSILDHYGIYYFSWSPMQN
ncbi:MAG: hypothetical protein AAFX55_05460 [Bacteroidota bacterium]